MQLVEFEGVTLKSSLECPVGMCMLETGYSNHCFDRTCEFVWMATTLLLLETNDDIIVYKTCSRVRVSSSCRCSLYLVNNKENSTKG